MLRYCKALWRNSFRRAQVERELDAEIRGYMEMMGTRGGIEQVKESVRDVRAGASLETVMQDLRYAVRTLQRNRGFTAVAIGTLALVGQRLRFIGGEWRTIAAVVGDVRHAALGAKPERSCCARRCSRPVW